MLESEEFKMLDAVCALIDRHEVNGSMRGRAANGLIELVRAFTRPCGPSPLID